VNIANLLLEQARQRGDAPALIDSRGKRGRERIMSFKELEPATLGVAAQLASNGICRGDGVLILHPMSIELYVFLIALFRMGCVGVFLDPSAGRSYIEHCLQIYSPRAFYGSRKAQLLRLSTSSLRMVSPAFCPRWFPGTHRISMDLQDGVQLETADVEDSTPALITFTSGSTGKPKAALRSHGFLIAQHQALKESLSLEAGIMDLTTLPIFVLANLASGVTSVIPDADMRFPGKINSGPVVRQIRNHAISTTAASPAFISRLAAHCRLTHEQMPQLVRVFMGGAPVFPSHLREARTLFPIAEITAVYGSTEAEPMAEVSLSQMAEDDFQAMERGAGLLAGIPVKAITLRILREQWGVPVSALTSTQFDSLCLGQGEIGEIVVAGPHVLPGYLNGAGDLETKFTVDDRRWHRTGDLGWLDANGRLWLMGRASATIRDERGVLYPFAAESAAMQVSGVRRAAILQVANRRILAIETDRSEARESAAHAMAWAKLDEVRVVPSIPMDKRHNAKIDYVALATALVKH